MPRLNTITDLQAMDKKALRDMLKWAMELGSMYDHFIAEDDEDVKFEVGWGSSKHRAPGIHASEISGCQRPTIYSLMGVERRDTKDPYWKKRFRIGHMVHGMLQEDLARMCDKTDGVMRFFPEVEISPEFQPIAETWNLHSHCDGVIYYYDKPTDVEPTMRVGVEIKTESGPQFEDLEKPRDYHLEQVCIYMKTLDLPMMWMLYYNKSNSNLVESKPPWFFTWDGKMDKMWFDLEDKFAGSISLAEEGKLPERLESLKCEFCPFSWTCDPDWVKRKEERRKQRAEWEKKRRRAKPGRRSMRRA